MPRRLVDGPRSSCSACWLRVSPRGGAEEAAQERRSPSGRRGCGASPHLVLGVMQPWEASEPLSGLLLLGPSAAVADPNLLAAAMVESKAMND